MDLIERAGALAEADDTAPEAAEVVDPIDFDGEPHFWDVFG
jgi:hypothetical protein